MESDQPERLSTALPERDLVTAALERVRARGRCAWSWHGVAHWWRVRANGRAMAPVLGANATVVTLFAMFHDAERENEDEDPGHGPRAAAWLARLREGAMIDSHADARTDSRHHTSLHTQHDPPHASRRDAHHDATWTRSTASALRALPDRDFALLCDACALHTTAADHADPTIAACLIADRLDLARVGIAPDLGRMPRAARTLSAPFIEAAIARGLQHRNRHASQSLIEAWGVLPEA